MVSFRISCPDDGNDAETLLGLADAAMFRVKRLGQHGFAWHGQRADASRHAPVLPANSQPGPARPSPAVERPAAAGDRPEV